MPIKHQLNIILFGAFLLLISASAIMAQDTPPVDTQKQQLGQAQTDTKPDLLSELGLSQDQVRQIRQMNVQRKPVMMEANRRLREANRNLDMVIYGDSVNEDEFQLRLREFQSAQADVARLRFMNELTVRRILTPEQLVKFRDVRRRFAEERKEMRKEIGPRKIGQIPRGIRQNRPMRPNQ